MAMGTDKKLYVAVGVLAILGGAVYLQQKKQAAEAESYTLSGQQKELPKIEIKDDQVKKVDRIEIQQPAGDAGKPTDVVLVKKGDEWQLEKPLTAKANQSNVKSLLDNLKALKVTEVINPDKSAYGKYDVSDDKALHAVFKAGKDTVAEYYFGENGSRGEMTRIAGHDGVYAVEGYSSFLYSREVKDWRDKTIFKFDDKNAVAVEVENENGTFTFDKSGDTWTAKFKKAKSPTAAKLKDFDPSKIQDLLRAYKGLNADGFGEDKKAADVGLTEPKAKVTITMKDGGKKVLEVGDKAEGSDHYAKVGGADEIYTVSSFSADWATAEASKFEKSADKDKGASQPPGGGFHLPAGMGMPPGAH